MDPLSIAASVTKITSTCAVTGKALYDLSCKYQDAPRTMIAISSEMTVISASLSQIEAIISSKHDSETLLRSRPAIAATLDTALTGCMVLFSCLDEEIKNVSKHGRGNDTFSWKGKMRVVWKHETFQELLDGIRGQQLAINTLIQLLQMDSLQDITRLLQRNARDLQGTVERTRSLRHSHPEVNVAGSIYNRDDLISLYTRRDSMLASSEIDFDFDDVVVDSAVYRRVLAAAKRQGDAGKRPEINTDLVGNIGSGPMGKESITVATRVRSKQPSWQPANDQTYRGRQPQKTTNPRHATRKSDHGSAAKACARCDLNFAKSEQFVKALGARYHYDCFTCKDCGVAVAKKFFPINNEKELDDNPPSDFQSYALCETDYFRRLDLICFGCGKALRGSYVTALGRKYHLEHFSCSHCLVELDAVTEFFEHSGAVLCEACYSQHHAIICTGCEMPIVRQGMVKFHRGVRQDWHLDCNIIHNTWDFTREGTLAMKRSGDIWTDTEGHELDSVAFLHNYRSVMAVTSCMSTTLSRFEKTMQPMTEDFLQHVSHRIPHKECILSAALFLSVFGILFTALEATIVQQPNVPLEIILTEKARNATREGVALFEMIASPTSAPPKEIALAMSRLIHCIKLLVKSGLEASTHSPQPFLDAMALDNFTVDLDHYKTRMPSLLPRHASQCSKCKAAVEENCFQTILTSQVWHVGCFPCTFCPQVSPYASAEQSQQVSPLPMCRGCGRKRFQSIQHITRLQRYRHLLWIALAQLMATMKVGQDALQSASFYRKATFDGHEVVANKGGLGRGAKNASKQPRYVESVGRKPVGDAKRGKIQTAKGSDVDREVTM